ncbi:MAG TPA: glutamyl-tRNA reductase, partial [Cyclobacteriaceae bacterium]|nr:glutamyl-tRNA reductase [Cyclobacteriaceae bacterium]
RHISNWSLLGTNFSKADVKTRSRFALTRPMVQRAYELAAQKGFYDFLVLSTCNRTEFYTSATIHELKKFVFELLPIESADLGYFYFDSGIEAVRHFFRVVAGLDSQIIGDYEIVSQVKSALDESRNLGLAGTIIDRISNFSFQASKKIKTQTNLSSGKYSVSYATVEWLRHKRLEQPIHKALVIGTGDFGSAVARNLRHYFTDCKIGLTNRTHERAQSLADEINGTVIPFQNFQSELADYDLIITTVGLEEYLIHPEHLQASVHKLLLDLSVPQAVNPLVKNIPHVQLFSVDDISAFHNQWLSQRHLEIHEAEQILEDYINKLLEWQLVFSQSRILAGYKEKLGYIGHPVGLINETIEKPFKELVKRFRVEGYRGCSVIETLNEIITIEK